MGKLNKRCNKCGETKATTEFYRDGHGGTKLNSWCKECCKVRSKERPASYGAAYSKKMREEFNNRTEAGINFIKNTLIGGAKFRMKHQYSSYGIEFTITKDDIHIPDLCPILKIPLRVSSGAMSDSSPTLDRIDSTRGYIPGNVQVISNKANRMKNNATNEEIKLLYEWASKQTP